MLTKDFDYYLPAGLIAQQPAPDRAQARLMLVRRATGEISHYRAADLPSLLQQGDLMVLNDTRVIPARMFGKKQKTGGKVEVLFIEECGKNVWQVFLHSSGRPKVGDIFLLAGDKVKLPAASLPASGGAAGDQGRGATCSAEVALATQVESVVAEPSGTPPKPTRLRPLGFAEVALPFTPVAAPSVEVALTREAESHGALWRRRVEARVISIGARGRVVLELHCNHDFAKILEEDGLPPLPPYIKRPENERSAATPLTAGQACRRQRQLDSERYQTVYARVPGAIAAPTAGLHLSSELLAALEKMGIQRTAITLHVGPGTFVPVKCENVEDHKMESERFVIEPPAARQINQAIAEKRRIVAVGTTVVRALESAMSAEGQIAAGSGRTEIFIYPPFRFQVVGALLTNFHLPRSTLLMLVSAFAGRALIRHAYEVAVKEKYRFYSYGDCMLIV